MFPPKNNEPNTAHFITTKIWGNIWLFEEDKYCKIIIDNLKFYRKKFEFKLIGYNILPWHLHLIMQLSEEHNNISTIMRDFKSHVAREIIDDLKKNNKKLLSRFWVQSEPLLGLKKSRSRGSDLPVKVVRSKFQSKLRKLSKYQIWQPDFYDFNIHTENKLEQKINYVNCNAVKHGLAKDPTDWPYSSYHNYQSNDNSLIRINRVQ
ncbi:MAG: transposase [Patescibacteria group bacterium]